MSWDSVFDCALLGYANGALAGRRPGNRLDLRLRSIEECLEGKTRARYNPKLRTEYEQQLRRFRNDVVSAFMSVLADRGVFVKRNTVSSYEREDLRRIGWPWHDQHLVAAAHGGIRPMILSTEAAHGACGRGLQRKFGIRVKRL